MTSYMGDHDFRRWQRRVISLYYQALGIEEGDIPASDLRDRYDAGQKPEEVAAELVAKEKAATDPLA